MSPFWDSSILVECAIDPDMGELLEATRPFCRAHVLAETFSTLTGGRLGFRVDPGEASQFLAEAATSIQFVELSPDETLAALSLAKSKGVRGGRVHDFLHLTAARKAGCLRLVTFNQSDFMGLDANMVIESP